MKPFPDFNTAAGIRAVAEHLDGLAADPANWEQGTPDHRIGHITVYSTHRALTSAATLLKAKAGRRALSPSTAMETDVMKMDCVRHCGSPQAALETIRRQLATQGMDMDPAAVKRCERAARAIEAHIEKEAHEAALKAEDESLVARVAAGKEPGASEILAPGTEVAVKHGYRDYLGTVSACKIGPHPVLGKKHPVALYTVSVSHIRETRQKRYAYYPSKLKKIEKLIWKDIRVLS